MTLLAPGPVPVPVPLSAGNGGREASSVLKSGCRTDRQYRENGGGGRHWVGTCFGIFESNGRFRDRRVAVTRILGSDGLLS